MSSKPREAAADSSTGSDEYDVRWYQSGDDDEILSLFEDQLDRVRSAEYFEWKYLGDPYLSHAPVNVAAVDGDVVGVQAYLPFEFRDGDRTFLGLQPADAVVHGDHRRNGLYTRMTRQAIDRYTEGEPALFFNYPSPGALDAQRKLGWESVDTLDVHYRIARPSAFLESALDGTGGNALGRVADAVARGAYGVVDRVAPAADDVEVDRHHSVPSETLASLYETYVPDRLHVHRESRFYDWWFANPAYDYTTYVARSSGRPVAALVTRTVPGGVLQLREAVPLAPYQPTPEFGRLLAAALDDHPDADVVKSVGSTLPDDLLARFGFVSDSTPLLDERTTPLNLAARPLTDEARDGRRPEAVTDRSNWFPTFVEVDRD